MSHFNFSYVSMLVSDDEYGRQAISKLRENLRNKSICFAVDRLFDPSLPGDDLAKITQSIKDARPSSKVYFNCYYYASIYTDNSNFIV